MTATASGWLSSRPRSWRRRRQLGGDVDEQAFLFMWTKTH